MFFRVGVRLCEGVWEHCCEYKTVSMCLWEYILSLSEDCECRCYHEQNMNCESK